MLRNQKASQINDLNVSRVGECARDDVVHVRRQRRCRRDSAQRRLGARATLRFQGAPGTEGAHQPGGHLRVLRVKREHEIGDKIITASVRTVELRVVGLGECPDQGADAIGIGGSVGARGGDGDRVRELGLG